MVACQAPLSMRFSRQEYWSGLPSPPPGDLPDPGIEPTSLTSPALAGGFFTTSTTWEAHIYLYLYIHIYIYTYINHIYIYISNHFAIHLKLTWHCKLIICVCTQSCLTLCDPMDYSPPGSSVHGIFQASILEQVAISFSRESSWPRDRTQASCISCIGKWVLYQLTHQGSQKSIVLQ